MPEEAVELFLERTTAEVFIAERLMDEPDRADLLSVAPIELDERNLSPN